MELHTYYSLEETSDRKTVLKRLKDLQSESRIIFELDGEVFKIKDLDLEEEEISELIELFDQNDVIAYYDREGEDDEDDDPYEDDYFDDEY